MENIKYLQYVTLLLIVFLSFFTVLVRKGKNRLISLLILPIFIIAFSLFLYSGVFAIILGILSLFVFTAYYGYEKQLQYFSQEKRRAYSGKAVSLVVGLLFCIGAGYAFYAYTLDYFNTYHAVGVITLMNYKAVAKELYSNYIIITVFIITFLFATLVWFISILSTSEKGSK